MPLKILSSDLPERQAALFWMMFLYFRGTGREVYVGSCDCPPAAEHYVLLIAATPMIRCVFCKQPVQLERLPRYKTIWTEEGKCEIWTDEDSDNSPGDNTSITSRRYVQ